MKARIAAALLAVALVVGVVYGLSSYRFATGGAVPVDASSKPRQDDITLPAVSVVKATAADFVETVLITGSVTPRNEVLIHPEVEGFRIVEIAVEEGDTVAQDQVLARLANVSLDAQVAQVEANIARAEAAIAVARSGIVQAEASVKEAANAFERAKPLKQSGYLSGATYDQRESASLTADSKLISARDTLKSAEADKVASQAQLRDLTWRRSRTEVRAPVGGVISRRTARVGAVASALNDPLFRIVAKGEVELDADVAESDVAKIREGQQATVTITGTGEVVGTVRLVSSEVDRTTRLGKVRVFFGARPDLKIGAFGRGIIVTARNRGLSVPTSAVVYQADGGKDIATVQVVADGRVAEHQVKVGLKTQTAIEILEGLSEGDTIVARSGSFLRDGDAVRPISAETKLSGVR